MSSNPIVRWLNLEEDPEIFVDIKRNIVRLLDDKEAELRRQLQNPVKARDTAVQTNAAHAGAIIKARSEATDRRNLC